MGISKIKVEVAYATPEEQKIIELDVMAGTSMYDAVEQSGITELFPQIDIDKDKMGIFGKAVKNPREHELIEGDRVEIYRPLIIDPKQARLNRAAKK
ncbi:RnfH family protein [Alkalimarinus coralli]|uniref:RnfH family protein n=1 Tax=Alkalimarinus coralli TaxID=2935863 RepID=UPI00202B1E28|nr:RnfH family protein [Alkalimarinus coralli]